MKFTMKDITCVIPQWMQTRFTRGAVANFRKYYPDIPIIVVDDGSAEEKMADFNRAYQREVYQKDLRFDNSPLTGLEARLIQLDKHMGHGSALDYGVEEVKTQLMLTMDNDIRLREGGLVEEYLEEMNKDPENIYAVGTTMDNEVGEWIDPWFSLYRVDPIKELHLTFSSMVFEGKEKTLHLGTGGFLHTMLTYDELHRPKLWKYVAYPAPEFIPKLHHLKRHSDQGPGHPNYDLWEELIDG